MEMKRENEFTEDTSFEVESIGLTYGLNVNGLNDTF